MTREDYQHRIEQFLDSVPLSSSSFISSSQLHEAMRYSALGGGKRVRPLLVYATGEALKINVDLLDLPAAAIELIHAYSLIHDDLPSMDDDALRRGKPTTHIAFDEATAILAGDALQTLAFQLLSNPVQGICAENQLKILNILAIASGPDGMVKGQSIDLAAVGKQLTEDELEIMHNHKTGALITASVEMATYCMETKEQANSEEIVKKRRSLTEYSQAIGLAFQVRDDILDIQSDTETLGKQQGSDIAAGKPTYPSIMGMSATKEKLFNLNKKALDSLIDFGEEADSLREIASFIVKRIA
ncbi:(2E,6E)-farnesyl diphosphate synthase [Cocleimonas flava]|uniref:Farnesyl-diphosphate synthase n=1 Tax=Cocleimonas flava TaxID=634765 RepID=A0A4R1F368_9GAMM|nr:farnesyl diphosphate synthase [Cocleimonas flava]TCJ88657.1 farnesyl-diphosphate synthase [Cocleimonas flava]